MQTSSRKSVKTLAPRDLSIFCRQMSLIVGSDITLAQGLDMLLAQEGDTRLRTALTEILDKIQSENMPFSEAFSLQSHVFPEYMTNMIVLGEQSGTLEVVFAQLADYYEKEYKVHRKVSAALTYPTILATLMLGVIALLVLRILPMFEQILINMGGTMPALTRGLMDVSNFLVGNMLWLLIAVAVIVIAYLVYKRTGKGTLASSKNRLRSPISGAVRSRVLTARFARSAGILLRAGVPVLQTMEAMNHLLGNAYAESMIDKARMQIQNEGFTLTEALRETKLFPPLFLRLIGVGETTGQLDEMMLKSAAIYDEEVDDALEKLTTSIEPMLILILSLVVGVILLSVMLPMINIMAQIG